MKYFISLLVCCLAGAGYSVFRAALAGSFVVPQAQAATAQMESPAGRYVDVRSATVFGGACHIGSEDGSQGRNGLFALEFSGGVHAGQALEGIRLVGVMRSDSNLGRKSVDGGAPQASRQSMLIVDAPSEAGADAAVAWLREMVDAGLGDLTEVRRAEVRLDLGKEMGGTFHLEVPGLLESQGAGLPDRACCSMPEQVWYGPLLGKELIPTAVVAFTESARFEGAGDFDPWRYDGANTAFLGSFTSPSNAVLPSCCGVTATDPMDAQSW